MYNTIQMCTLIPGYHDKEARACLGWKVHATLFSEVQKDSYKKCFNKEASSKANNAILLKKGNQNLPTTVTTVHVKHY